METAITRMDLVLLLVLVVILVGVEIVLRKQRPPRSRIEPLSRRPFHGKPNLQPFSHPPIMPGDDSNPLDPH